MADGELYEVLGVSRGATADEIKRAYRRLARSLHPDRNGLDATAGERFRRVSHAYGILSDPRRRAMYDRHGLAALEDGFVPPSPRPRAAAANARFVTPTERVTSGPAADGGRARASRVGELLDGLRGGPVSRRGGDLSCAATVDLVEAVRGCEREIRIKGTQKAPDRLVRVRIPPGVRSGERLRLRGLGRAGSRGGESGDLWISIHVRAHPHFFLEDGDLHVHLPVTPLEAYEGATVEVPTPHGTVQVRVPPRSQAGAMLRVRARGVKRGDTEPGDLLLHLRIVLPTNDGLREVYAQLDGAMTAGVRSGLRFE